MRQDWDTENKTEEKPRIHLDATCQCTGSFFCSFLFSVLEEVMDNSWLSEIFMD